MSDATELKRSLSLPTITFYGVGTIIGAGIYALIGKVGAASGIHLPYAFLLAGVIAAFTALSYAELSSRFPQSAGAALYIYEAWKKGWLSQLVGAMVAVTGIVSAATISNAFVGYLNLFIELPDAAAIVLIVLLLTLIASWGIQQSAFAVTLITLIEVAGLLFVIYTARHGVATNEWAEVFVLPDVEALLSVAVGGFLAFYAFIGFEDMVNVVEEVKQPRKNLPRAVVLAVAISTLLYFAVSALAARMLPAGELAASAAPLADIVVHSGYSPAFIGVISLFAVINGALVQMIMASRLLYGMSRKGLAPAFLSKLNRRTQTPIAATVIIAALILVLALSLDLTTLAKVTSSIMLVIFLLVNLALLVVKRKTKDEDEAVINYPTAVPIAGALLSFALLASVAVR